MPQFDGFDYSFSRPDPAAMHQAGAVIVGRYLYDGDKGLTAAEAASLHTTGLGIAPLYYEANRGYLLDPSSARGYGVDAVNHARALGVPDAVPVCHSLDEDTGPDQFPVVARSMQAINAVRGRPEGFYGEADAIDYLWDRGLISFAVNTAAVGWSAGRVSAHAAIWQYTADVTWNGSGVDYLTILDRAAVERAAWWPPGHTPPASTPTVTALEDVMAIVVYPGDAKGKGGAIGTLNSGMELRTLSGPQWAAVSSVRAKLPAAARPPIVKVTKAEYAGLPRA